MIILLLITTISSGVVLPTLNACIWLAKASMCCYLLSQICKISPARPQNSRNKPGTPERGDHTYYTGVKNPPLLANFRIVIYEPAVQSSFICEGSDHKAI
ncbi:hypothetical protein K438DRAFT_352935 [Mycena galopus ATCC 62051]|nr:hypothetical protein K438DRAFT_352935 [Mycena galopus ATCC 62051]